MSRLLLAALAMLTAAALALAAPAAAGPKMAFETTEKSFGDVKEGETLTATFSFENQGDLNLIIEKVSPSCGCTVAEHPEVVPPGGKGEITLKLDTTGITGAFRKTAVVASNDSSQPFVTLVMTGETLGRIKVEGADGRRLKLAGCLGQEITTSATLVDPQGGQLFIAAVENPMDDYLKAELTPLEPGKRYRLTLTATASQPMEFAGPLFLVVPGSGKVSLFAMVEVRGPFTAQPRDLYFGGLRRDQPALSRSILVEKACVDRLEITKLEYNRELLEVKQVWDQPGERLFLEVTPRLRNLPTGPLDEQLAIQAAGRLYKVGLKGMVR
jgi:hypothetical protein